MRVFLIVMVMALCGWPSCCLAINITFLQGDAFFPTSFDEKQLQKFLQAKSPMAYYAVTNNTGLIGGAGCGGAGHFELQFAKFAQVYREGLQLAYDEFRQELVQGEIFVLVYGKDFDLGKFRLGLQYNEHWVAEEAKFRVGIQEMTLRVLTDSQWTTLSCGDSTEVPPLSVKLVETPRKMWGPVRLEGEFKLVVLPDCRYDDYCSRKDGARIIVIDKEAITEYVAKEGKWVEGKREEAKEVE